MTQMKQKLLKVNLKFSKFIKTNTAYSIIKTPTNEKQLRREKTTKIGKSSTAQTKLIIRLRIPLTKDHFNNFKTHIFNINVT